MNFEESDVLLRLFKFQSPLCNLVSISPFVLLQDLMRIPVPAAYLYDAVVLYAEALREVLIENGNSTDGTAIFQKIKSRSYESK